MKTISDLPDPQRISLLRGYVERSWRMPWLADEHPELAHAAVQDERAHQDGIRLRQALDLVFSSDTSSELHAAEADYDRLAAELNRRYGDGVVVTMSEGGTPGLRGFRLGPFTTETSTTEDQVGNRVETVRDLRAEDAVANDAD